MAKRDLIDDLVDLLYPLPNRGAVQLDDGGPDDPAAVDDAWDAACDWAEQRRRELEDSLRTAQDADVVVLAPGDIPVQFDPLISELKRAQADRRNAEERIRLLLAYAREYSPRAYSLAELGRAAGISGSGVRTVYNPTDVGRVSRLLHGRRPDDLLLRADAADNECAAIKGKRNQPAARCANPPSAIGGAPHTDQLFGVCASHSYLVIDPRPIAAAPKPSRTAAD